MNSKAPRPHLFAVVYLRLLVNSLKARCDDDPAEKVSFNGSCLKNIIHRGFHNIIDHDDHTDHLQTSHYEDVCACFQQLDDLHGWEDGEEKTDDDANDKEDRHRDIARFFDLEAAMHLKKWNDVASICASDYAFPDPKFYAPIMDLTLQLNLPPTLAIQIIKVRSIS